MPSSFLKYQKYLFIAKFLAATTLNFIIFFFLSCVLYSELSAALLGFDDTLECLKHTIQTLNTKSVSVASYKDAL